VGDCSYREIPADAEKLTWTHAYYRPARTPTSIQSFRCGRCESWKSGEPSAR
jgi:hypothetical protein